MTSFCVKSLTSILFQCINLKQGISECRIEVRMIPDSCNRKGFDHVNLAFSEISLWSRVETRTRAVECYQAISIVIGLNGRLIDL